MHSSSVASTRASTTALSRAKSRDINNCCFGCTVRAHPIFAAIAAATVYMYTAMIARSCMAGLEFVNGFCGTVHLRDHAGVTFAVLLSSHCCFVSHMQFGNPHSRTHMYGWESENAVEKARQQVSKHSAAKELAASIVIVGCSGLPFAGCPTYVAWAVSAV
jgi:hypothetical protein